MCWPYLWVSVGLSNTDALCEAIYHRGGWGLCGEMALANQSASLYQCLQLQNGDSMTTSLGCHRIKGNDIWKVFSPLPEYILSLFHIYISNNIYIYIDICQYISIYTNANQYLIIVIHFLCA